MMANAHAQYAMARLVESRRQPHDRGRPPPDRRSRALSRACRSRPGYRIRTISILPGFGTLGACEHYPRPDLPPFENALAECATLLAGEQGALMVPRPGGWLEPSDDEAEIERVADAAIAALPRDEAAFLSWSRTVPSSGTDADKADELAKVAGAEKFAFLALAQARAARLVAELAPTIGALVPTLLERRVMTGEDIEAAIAALAPQASGTSA